MKKLSVLFLIFILISFTGCAEKITLDNIDTVENEYQYSSVFMGRYLKETAETKIVSDAKDFAKKFISVQQNRAYNEKTSVENEKIMYTDDYIDKHGEEINKLIEEVKSFYTEYELKTDVQSVDYNKVVNLGGDAFVNAVAKIRLTGCGNLEVAKALGFENGVNSNILCEYNIKMKYIGGEYFIYDYEIVEKEGYLVDFKNYRDIINKMSRFGIENEYEIKDVVNKLAYTQNTRDYNTLRGDEDYPYLSESYKAMLNSQRDDIGYTKQIYQDYKIITEMVSCNITDITVTENAYKVRADIKVKLVGCVSQETAKNIGYKDGIGSVATMNYVFTINRENGELKLFDSQLLN